MKEIKQKLKEKRLALHSLILEIRELETQVLNEEWKDKPECEYPFSEISNGKCPYGETHRGMILCHNINCHK